MKKICRICGKEFDTSSSRRAMCYDEHYHKCPVCGNDVLTKDLQHLNSCCSAKCSRQLATATINDKYEEWPSSSDAAKEKRLHTLQSRYGTDNVMNVPEIRKKCKEHKQTSYKEHKEEIEAKKKETSLLRYGTEHPMQSDAVKSKVEQTCIDRYGAKTSLLSEDVKDRIRKTNLSRYGVENPLSSDEIKRKVEQTNLERYGSVHYAGSADHRSKFEGTMIERYGVAVPTLAPEIADQVSQSLKEHWADSDKREVTLSKTQQTIQNRYGEDGLKSKEIRHRSIQTSRDKYGADSYSQTAEFKEAVRQTSLARYGTENAMQNDDVKARFVQSMIDKHGVMWPAQTIMSDPSKYQEFLIYKSDIRSYIEKIPFDERTEYQIASRIGVTPTVVSDDVVRNGLQHLIKYTKSNMEDEVVAFIRSITSNIQIVRNCRTVISPYEIDIYLPDLKIAFECNGTYAHNSSETCFGNDPKSPSYHKKKTELCEKNNIFLMHIYSYQWKFNKDIVKSRIRNCLNANECRYFARKLKVREVSYLDSIDFLNSNHIQGATSSKIRLGLYQNDELVSLMTFSKPRGTMGHSTKRENFDWELTRFCSKLNTNVVGGASKLFKHFVDTYHLETVSSFSSRDCTTGGVYSKLGFELDGYVEPGYVWVDSKTDKAYSRTACQKHNLRKLLNDETIDVENQSESQIMRSHGFVQVFNSGLIRWVWKSNR